MARRENIFARDDFLSIKNGHQASLNNFKESEPFKYTQLFDRTRFGSDASKRNGSSVPCPSADATFVPLPVFTNDLADWGHEFKKCTKKSRSLKANDSTTKYCTFCKKNGETIEMYMSHQLSDQNKTICPILSACICSACGNKGHTRSYCPSESQACCIVRMMSEHNKKK